MKADIDAAFLANGKQPLAQDTEGNLQVVPEQQHRQGPVDTVTVDHKEMSESSIQHQKRNDHKAKATNEYAFLKTNKQIIHQAQLKAILPKNYVCKSVLPHSQDRVKQPTHNEPLPQLTNR